MGLALVTGFASTLWIREDLEVGETWHTAVGVGSVVLMAVGAVLTRYFTRDPRLRKLHPWFGIAAVMGALFQGILGIQLLP